ncbi:MAG: tetratricopeptide repeat protein [Verrucomicrobiota bacterium]|nr:tetratricopeptide repeat protein [Verrucomicrobiota bacterium]
MKWIGAFVVAVAVAVFGASALAEEANEVTHATEPLAAGVPEVAVVRLRALSATKLSEDDRRVVALKLAQALVASRQPEDAIAVLNDPLLATSFEAKFVRAQAFAALGRWNEALPLYREAAANGPEARFGEAEALRALRQFDEALDVLSRLTSDPRWALRAKFTATEILLEKNDAAAAKRLLDSSKATSQPDRKVRRLLAGRVEWQSKHSQRAVGMFASILKNPQGATHQVLMAALYAIADAHLEFGTPDIGDDYLEEFIEHHPTDRELPVVFSKLDQLYAAERRQSRHDLGRWARESAQPRRALAQWYLARAELRLARRELALQAFAALAAEHPDVPELAPALLEYASLLLQDGRAEQAHAIVESARALHPAREMMRRIDFLGAQSEYAARHFAPAAAQFQRVAHESSPPHGKEALINASLAWFSAGENAQGNNAAQQLSSGGGDEQTRGDLALEAGLVAAARGDKGAADALQKFVHDFPKHPRVSEAWVVLAELAFRAAPPQIEEARRHLARANDTQPTAAASERADYLAIWLEDVAPNGNAERTVQLANDFLHKHADSALVSEVRLKLAETNFARQDFAGAQTQFELLAQANPNGPLADKARFFAAKSATNTMGKTSLDRALVLFDEVVKRGGELKWAARNEQAVIERKLGKPQEALTLYEEVLKGDAKPEEKREALCGKGDVYYDVGALDSENYRRAIEVYDQLAAQRDASPHWRNQAIFKKGMCLEKLNAGPDALATFYGIVESETRPGGRSEFFWFYKAGFNAARLLEEQSKWQAAAAVYEKLAFAGGTRSEEAKARLDRLRLEHFLWDE